MYSEVKRYKWYQEIAQALWYPYFFAAFPLIPVFIIPERMTDFTTGHGFGYLYLSFQSSSTSGLCTNEQQS